MRLKLINQRWFQVLGIGAVLFFGAEQVLKFTGNINLVPTVILIGAFVVPITFVSYFFSAEHVLDKTIHPQISITMIALSFFLGGVVGVIAAGVIEYSTLTSLSVSSLFAVAVIEEAAKLIVPVLIFLYSSFRSKMDGLLFGVASGMGFAALETMGYGLVALINAKGNIGVLEEVLLIRGLLSPVGHAAWTGIVCAALWGARQRTGKTFNIEVVGYFALAVLLHALWDISGTASNIAVTYTGYVIIGGVSLLVLILQFRSARRLSLGRQQKNDRTQQQTG